MAAHRADPVHTAIRSLAHTGVGAGLADTTLGLHSTIVGLSAFPISLSSNFIPFASCGWPARHALRGRPGRRSLLTLQMFDSHTGFVLVLQFASEVHSCREESTQGWMALSNGTGLPQSETLSL